MRITKRIALLTLAFATLVAISSLLAYRAGKWLAAWMIPSRSVQTPDVPSLQPKGNFSHRMSSDEEGPKPARIGAVMSEAFNTGKLPEPLDAFTTDPDAAAAELAEKVSLKDKDSTSALLTAFKLSGFNIRGNGGEVLVGAKNTGQGIGFESWEAASIAKLYGDELHITLADLSDAISQTLPDFKNVPLNQLLLDGLRADAASKKPELRFWSRFIVEMGKKAAPTYDLMSPSLDPANAKLDAVQFAFITRRLAADVAIAVGKAGKNGQDKLLGESQNLGCSGHFQPADFLPSYRTSRLLDGVWRPTGLRYAPIAFQEGTTGPSSLPCNMTESELQILDVVAAGYGFGFDKLMEVLTEPGALTKGATGFLGKYAAGVVILDALLVYGKLVLTVMTAEATITMDSSPLVRNTSPQPGCQRKLTAKIEQKTGKWQIVNCLRLALLHAGIDVDVPKDGPIDGARTQWHIVEGGVDVSQAAAAGENTALVEWVSNGSRIQDAGTYAGIPGIVSDATAVSDFTQPTTSENGTVEVNIEGCARRSDLSGWAVPIMKTAKVQLTFAAKPPNLTQDIFNALEHSLGTLSGPMVLLTTAPVEMFLRSRWFASPVFTIPVKDWKACNGGWSGKITYEVTGQSSSSRGWGIPSGPRKGPCTIINSANTRSHSEWNLTGSTAPSGTLEANWSQDYSAKGNETGCYTSSSSTAGQDQGRAEVQISVTGEQYFIGVNPPPVGQLNPNAVTHVAIHPIDMEGNTTTDRSTLPMPLANPGAWSGKLDPNQPWHLSGTQSLPNSIGGTTTLHWDLQSCSRVGKVCDL